MGDTYIEHGSSVKIAPTAHPAIIAAVDAAAGSKRESWSGPRTITAAGTTYTGTAKPTGSGTITFVVTSTAPVKAEAPAKAAPKKAAAPTKAAAPAKAKAAPKKAGKK